MPDRPSRGSHPAKRSAVEAPERPAAPPADDEPTLLHHAWDALGHGDTATALATLELDAKLHPTGGLAEERDALRIDVLLRLSRTDEARTRAREFAANYPDSIHGDLIARALDTRMERP
jgi:hypothetical protein